MSKIYILCVDDEKIVLDSLRAQLNRHFGNRYSYEFAESGEEALEILDELDSPANSILVIISDWLMPNMKGDEFLLKAHSKFPHVFKLMLTGQADNEAIENLVNQCEKFKVMYKPWDEQEIIKEISRSVIF